MVQLTVLSALAFILSCITLSRQQNVVPQPFSGDCCTQKEVGGVRYTQVAGSTDGFDCDGQCVYQEDGKPGTRTCFKSGGSSPQPAECTASYIGSQFVPVIETSGGIIFKTRIGTFFCSILVNVTCFTRQDYPDIEGSELENAFFYSESPADQLEWFCLHSMGIHCDFNEAYNNFTCHYVPPSVAEADILYVEGAQNVTGDYLEEEIAYCQNLCNTTSGCQFWTLSFTPEYIPTSRNHRGHSECGVRKYAPNVELKPTNSRNQFTGLKNNATYQNGSVYVNTYFPCPSPVHCRNACTAGIMAPDCTTWTWEPKYGGYGAICALNVYTPIRRLNITMRITKPVLISGCIGADATLCPHLPDHS